MNSPSVAQTLESLRVIETSISGWTGYTFSSLNSNTGSGPLEPLQMVCQSILDILEDLSSGGEDDDSTDTQLDNVMQQNSYMISFTDTDSI
jgi:hypothetical protein